MFVFVLGWLAQHRKGWVVLAAGTGLLAAGIATFLAGFTTHQPLISRVGVFIGSPSSDFILQYCAKVQGALPSFLLICAANGSRHVYQ